MESDDDTYIVIVGDDIDIRPLSTTKLISWEPDTEYESSLDTEVLNKVKFETTSKNGEIGGPFDCEAIIVKKEEVYLDYSTTKQEQVMEAKNHKTINCEKIIVKEEEVYFEYLSTNQEQVHCKQIQVKENLPSYNGSDQDYVLDSYKESDCPKYSKEKKRVQMCKPKERRSYVKTMKKMHPELRNDKKLLVKNLTAMMKEIQPPPLPEHYYDLDGIMLQCVYCKFRSESLPAASRHYREKHGARYLHCFACGVNFRSKTNLYKHEKKCKSPDAVLVLRARAACLGRKGRARPFLCKDKNTKPPPKRFDCPLCSASFTTKESWTAHSLMHAGKRPYVCPVCGRAYTSKTVLSRHVKKHDASSRYVCDLCRRCFNVKAALIAHLDTHKPLKRFACRECAKRYSQRANLLLHVAREHRGLPPPCACLLCAKRYPRMSVLKEHMQKMHGMSLMTRKMFYKVLPTLSQTNMEHAKVVMKNKLTGDCLGTS